MCRTAFLSFFVSCFQCASGSSGGAGTDAEEDIASACTTSGSRTDVGAWWRALPNSKYGGGSTPGSRGGSGLQPKRRSDAAANTISHTYGSSFSSPSAIFMISCSPNPTVSLSSRNIFALWASSRAFSLAWSSNELRYSGVISSSSSDMPKVAVMAEGRSGGRGLSGRRRPRRTRTSLDPTETA